MSLHKKNSSKNKKFKTQKKHIFKKYRKAFAPEFKIY
jgi:hypothetical protein